MHWVLLSQADSTTLGFKSFISRVTVRNLIGISGAGVLVIQSALFRGLAVACIVLLSAWVNLKKTGFYQSINLSDKWINRWVSKNVNHYNSYLHILINSWTNQSINQLIKTYHVHKLRKEKVTGEKITGFSCIHVSIPIYLYIIGLEIDRAWHENIMAICPSDWV